ncbi:MAG: SpaA isopeptide-forming pilin-related protein [Bacillota bacterium]|nr:SpaA isopeptide-forming pilin-related protein [Bacillota bacterium]MDW7678184.1 SpaA isopeptide-forming pilin-related protein [Bacillota bacterium]
MESLWRKNNLTYKRVAVTVLIILMIAAMMIMQMNTTSAQQGSFQTTFMGFRASQGGGNLNLGWTTGNLGNTWAEGEWVPYMAILNNVQVNYPGLAGMPDIEISYDFTNKGFRFVDLIRGIQVGTTQLTDAQGWPMANGSAFPMSNRTQLEAAQNSTGENVWNGFQLLNLPEVQAHRALDGSIGSPTDAVRKIVIKPQDLIDLGLQNENVIIIYFQLHESRSFIWDNSLQAGYDQSPTDRYGGYVYGDEPFASDQRLGSGYVPGSSGHAQLEIGGKKTVPIPIPQTPPGTVSGMKFYDSNANGVRDMGEPGIEGWRIFVSGVVDEIEFKDDVWTDAMGNYSFPNLTPGTTWRISEALHPDGETNGFFQTYPFLGAANVGQAVAVAHNEAGQAEVGWDVTLTLAQPNQHNVNFGNAKTGEIKVVKEDTYGNRLEGWEFTLFVEEEDEWVEVGKAVTEKVIMYDDSEEIFALFTDLMPGKYKLVETLEDGFAFFNPDDGIIEDIMLAAGQTKTVTFVNVELGEIKIIKEDGQGNLLEGWEFSLYLYEDDDWTFLEKKTTDEDGEVIFEDLLPGLYKVVETQQNGWMVVTPVSGEVQINLGAGKTETRTFVNTPVIDCFDETAWAFGGEGIAVPFTSLGFSNWGWTNLISEGEYTFDLIAAAGNNVIANGEKVGEVEVIYSGGLVTVTYNVFTPYELAEAHLHIGVQPLPVKQQGQNMVMTNAPGQFEFSGNVMNVGPFAGDIYVAAHAVVIFPCEEEVAITAFYESEEVFFMTVEEFELISEEEETILQEEEEVVLEDEEVLTPEEEEDSVVPDDESFNDDMKEPEEEVEVPTDEEEQEEPGNDSSEEESDQPAAEEEEDGGRPENPGGHAPGRNR